MVDELQDTNGVQLELITRTRARTCSRWATPNSRSTPSATPRWSCSRRSRERLSQAAIACLQVNFRSRPEILEVINLAFADAMGERQAAGAGARARGRGAAGGADPGRQGRGVGRPRAGLALACGRGADPGGAGQRADRGGRAARRHRRAHAGHQRPADLRERARAARGADLCDRRARVLGPSAGDRPRRLPARRWPTRATSRRSTPCSSRRWSASRSMRSSWWARRPRRPAGPVGGC